MKHTLIFVLVLIILTLLVLGAGIIKFNTTNSDIYNQNGTQINVHDGTYQINGQSITLKNGISEVEVAPGSASKIITRYFGNDVEADLNNDGVKDRVFLITQETGGSGTFFYVVARVNIPSGSVGSDAVFLGDRIAPQSTNMGKGNVVVVNYAERKQGEAFTVQPSEGKSKWLLLDPKTMQFGEVAQNFEGEANPAMMTLDMKPWRWVKTTYNNDTEMKPKIDRFVLAFKNDKTFSASTDCNGVGGEYTVTGNKISFTRMFSTQMYCEGSQESEFAKMLEETQSFLFTSKGELILELKFDSGSVIFN
ncbi:MAG: Uncharacterized protein LiPW41_685 [Parcubacteria group bacterium LiPW_41]|nr:MAG: Uncharacterized protein LiPW41_685 [Parcubacteria group bacterium LiPW_41]